MSNTENTPTTDTPDQPVTTLVGRHEGGLHGVANVATSTFTRANLVLASTVERNGIAAISGAPGNGKTFSVDAFLRTNPALAGRPWHWLDIPPKPQLKEVTLRLLAGIGVPHRSRDSNYILTEQLIPELAGRVVIIDEAQNLGTTGLQQARYFHDRGDHSWALILVGSTINQMLGSAAELSSRVAGRVEFKPMDAKTMLATLRAYHPVLAQLAPESLLRIDASYAHGNWRRWAELLASLLSVLDKQPRGTTPNDRHLAAAFAMVRG